MNLEILATFIAYLFLIVIIAYIASKRLTSSSDFFIGGRNLGAWVAAISSTSTSESGWIILGACGMAYKMGVAAVWFVPGVLAGYVFNWYFLANRLRQATAAAEAITLPDLLAHWFGDPHHRLRITAGVVIFLSMMGYVAAQMTATGKAFDAVFSWPYPVGVIVGAVVIILYTIMGGFRAVAWTDLLQGLLMVFGLVLLPLMALSQIGSIAELCSSLQQLGSELTRLDQGKSGAALFGMVVGLLGIGLGYPGQPQVLVRYMATRDWQSVRRGRVIAITWGLLVYYGAIAVGLCGRALIPEVDDPEYIFPILATQLLHPLFAGMMLAAIMAAIMSTADSQLLVASSAIVHDTYEKLFGKMRQPRQLVLLSRLAVVVLGLLSVIFALTEARVIFWLVLFAWSGLGASFGPVILAALTFKRTNHYGALAGMITGFSVTVIWKLSGLSDRIIYELVPAFLLALLVTVVVSVCSGGRVASRSSS